MLGFNLNKTLYNYLSLKSNFVYDTLCFFQRKTKKALRFNDKYLLV